MYTTTNPKHGRTLLVCITSVVLLAASVHAEDSKKTDTAKKAPPPARIDQFIAGTYEGTGKKTYLLHGPADLGDGRMSWSLICKNCKITMSWTTGSPKGHPDIAGREIEDKLPSAYSYGVMGQNYPGSDFHSHHFRNGTLIGARQMGNSVTVYSFYDNQKRKDTRSPRSTSTITMMEDTPQEE